MMRATLEKASGYQGDSMNLPVRDLAAALPFYETVLGFRVLSRSDTPHNSAVLARDKIQIGIAENDTDPEQASCYFGVNDVDALRAEYASAGSTGLPRRVAARGSATADRRAQESRGRFSVDTLGAARKDQCPAAPR